MFHMTSTEIHSVETHEPPSSSAVHFDFRSIKIHVYKNGDELDMGKEVAVTRREFKHWVIFLDGLTKKLKTTTAIHRLFTRQGIRIDHFDELEHRGEYVAVERGPFIACEYGKARNWTKDERKWKSLVRGEESKPAFLNSAETMDIYLKHEGYGSYTGLPYPFDGIMTRSPSTSALHMKGHLEKFGGSMERLNDVGKNIWVEAENKDEGIAKNAKGNGSNEQNALPKLVGLEDASRDDSADHNITETGEDVSKKEVSSTKLPQISVTKVDEKTKQTQTSPEESNEEEIKKLPSISKESRIPVKVIQRPKKAERDKMTKKVRSSRPPWEPDLIPSNYEREQTREYLPWKEKDPWESDFRRPHRRVFHSSSYQSFREVHRIIQPYDPDFN